MPATAPFRIGMTWLLNHWLSAAIDARRRTCPCWHDMAAGAMREDVKAAIKNQLRKDDHPSGADLLKICVRFVSLNPLPQHLHRLRQSVSVAASGHAEGLLSAATALDLLGHLADEFAGIQTLGISEGFRQQQAA